MRKAMAVIASLSAATAGILAAPGTANAGGGEGGGGGGFGVVRMTGDQEVPGPGDSAGGGLFIYTITDDQLCYVMLVHGIASATEAHLHTGARGDAGPVVVALEAPASGVAVSCVTAVPDEQEGPDNAAATLTFSELRAVTDNPAGFYVNAHNNGYPAGALRGQLC